MMLWAVAFAGGLFVAMIVMQHVGHGIAMTRMARDPESAKKGAGVIEGAVFGLLSLLVAFTFSVDRRHAGRLSHGWWQSA